MKNDSSKHRRLNPNDAEDLEVLEGKQIAQSVEAEVCREYRKHAKVTRLQMICKFKTNVFVHAFAIRSLINGM